MQAWTNGSQTYIRVRPNASTPIVAKVAKHTPLYVWGKYNGWYRVQTHDDIFGWVHYDLINSPGLNKVKALNADAVEIAAQRSSDITMWGTPDQLKAYYAKHGAKGAAKGLIEMGVPVTIGGAKPQTVQTKTAPRKAAPQPVAARRPAVRPQIVTSSLAQRVPVKAAPVVRQVAPPSVAAPTTLPAQSPVRALPPAPPRTVTRGATPPIAKAKAATRPMTASEKKRQQLRAKMGMTDKTPPVPIGQIAPVSPEDLMKARREYLKKRQQQLKDAPAEGEELGGPEVQPASFDDGANTLSRRGWAPFNTSGWSGSTRGGWSRADWSADAAPAIRYVVEETEAATLGDDGIDDEELKRWNSLPTLNEAPAKPAAKAEVKTVANAQKKAPSRGGSPRDRYKAAAKNGDFRQNMANQALSYRGTALHSRRRFALARFRLFRPDLFSAAPAPVTIRRARRQAFAATAPPWRAKI